MMWSYPYVKNPRDSTKKIYLSLPGFFQLAYALQVHPCCHRWQDFILIMAEQYPIVYICNILFIFFFLFMATRGAYGNSQARGQIELKLPTYTTATATQDPSFICNLRHSLRQCWILDPQTEAKDQTHILWLSLIPLSHSGNSYTTFSFSSHPLMVLRLFPYLGYCE